MKVVAALLLLLASVPCGAKKPNIAFVLIDDMGYNDFSKQSGDLKEAWPNANALAEEGVWIKQYYTQPLCTPTRGALMTGRHPIRLGLQHGVLGPFSDWGLPLEEATIADKLKAEGYRCYAVGKWHLGYSSWAATPVERGFDHYYGYLNGGEDYLTHFTGSFLDLLDDRKADWGQNGNYSSLVFQSQVERRLREHKASYGSQPFFLYYPMQTVHEPLEAIDQYTSHPACRNVANADRKTFCGMARAADDALGKTVQLVKDLFPNDDNIIVVAGDNGGLPSAAGNNWPLRGQKSELWEGGVRNNAVLWSNTLVPGAMRGKEWNGGLMHVMDWHATIRDLAGAKDKAGYPTDGMNMWDAITKNTTSPRTEVLLNIDPVSGIQGYRMGKWKLMLNEFNETWYPVPTSATSGRATLLRGAENGGVEVTGTASTGNFLFDIEADMWELTNVYDEHPDVVKELKAKLEALSKEAKELPTGYNNPDPQGRQMARQYYSYYPWLSNPSV